MNPTKEKLLEKGIPLNLLEIAEKYFSEGSEFCVIEHYPTYDEVPIWFWRIIHQEDDDIDVWTDWLQRFFTKSELFKIKSH